MVSFESLFEVEILRGLLKRSEFQEEYFKMFYDKLDSNLFTEEINKDIFNAIKSYVLKYPNNKSPSLKDIKTYMVDLDLFNSVVRDIMSEDINSQITYNKLIDDTKEWIKNSKLKLLIREASEKLERKENLADTYDSIGKTLSIDYDNNLGLNSDITLDDRLNIYKKRIEASIITGIPSLDEILGGGFQNKTLNIIAAPTHGGKSLMLSHITATNFKLGKNCVYITLEMSESEIYKRIDSNLLEVEMFKLGNENFNAEILEKYSSMKGLGRLFIKEYSAGSCSINTINSYLEDLYKQKDFKPDLLCIDYLTLMKSDRVTRSSNMYERGKLIAEELHGLSKELDIPIITAAQLNRASVGNLDSEINSISESFGIAQTSDIMISLLTDYNLKSKNRVLVKVNKNRNTGLLVATEIQINHNIMKYSEVENSSFTTNLNNNNGTLAIINKETFSDWWRSEK